MDRKKLFNTLAGLIIFIFLANFLANKFYWYSSVWYFDIIMHFLGGFWAGALALYIFHPRKVSILLIRKILLCVLAIGLGWEVFELLVDKTISQNPFNFLDSAADLFFDVTGGVGAMFYYLKNLGREER
jgi:uncharacterized membrane protein YjdF